MNLITHRELNNASVSAIIMQSRHLRTQWSARVLSAVDRRFEPRSGKTKDNTIGMCCFSANHASLRSERKY